MSLDDSNMNPTDAIVLTQELNIKTPTKTHSTILIILVIVLVIVGIIVSGLISKEFLTLYLFLLLFGLPILIIYRSTILNILPSNIANWITKGLTDVKKDIDDDTENLTSNTEVYSSDWQIVFLGIISLLGSFFILLKNKDSFIGILLSVFFCILSHLIISDLL